MKSIPTLFFLYLLLGLSGIGQVPVSEWQKIKSVELLKTNKDEITKLFSDESLDSTEREHEQIFYTQDAVISFAYSSGKCGGDFDDWKVPEWTVIGISIRPKNDIKLTASGIQYSSFRKERTDYQRKEVFTLYDKPNGISVDVSYDRVVDFWLYPSAHKYHALCKLPEVQEYYSSKRWRRNPKFEKVILDYNTPPNVVGLSIEEVTGETRQFHVVTEAKDPEGDVLTYVYKVSAGRIVGSGSTVIWDLSGVAPGSYSITAAVDDGCGLCGKFITKTVKIN